MIIAFLGNDGSGKTTLAKKFEDTLRSLGFDVHYRKEFNYFLLSRLRSFLPKEKVNRARTSFLSKEGGARKKAHFKAWLYLVWLDLFLEWLWNKLFTHNRVVVMDRYAYDFLMSWEWLGCANAYLRWLYVHFPKPDLAFILDVPAATAYLRKKDTHAYSLNYYEVQRKRYLNFAKTFEMRIIDTEKDVEECLREAITEFRRCFLNKLSDEDKVLLFYSFPKFDPFVLQELNLSFDWSGLNWEYIVNMAIMCSTENVLCRNLLRHHGGHLPWQVSGLLGHVLGKSNERVNLLVQTLKTVSKKLSEKNVPFLVMKTIAPFDYGATDVDILVRREDFERAREALFSIFKVSKSSRIHKAVTYQGAWLPIDLHYEISWLGQKVVDEGEVFARQRKILYKGVELSVPSHEDELLILSAHSLFQHHYTTLGELLQIVDLASENEINRGYILDSSAHYEWRDLLQSFLSCLAWVNFIVYCHSSFKGSRSEKRPINLDISPVLFHGFDLIPKKKPSHLLDLLPSIFRRVRYKTNQKLAYSENWLNQKVYPPSKYKTRALKQFYEEKGRKIHYQRNAYFTGNPWNTYFHKRRFNHIAEALSSLSSNFLDMGCAEGMYVRTYKNSHRNESCVGLDISHSYLKNAKKTNPDCEFVQGDGHNLPFKDRSFDVVLSSEVLEHLENPKHCFFEMMRVAKRFLLITFPSFPVYQSIMKRHVFKDVSDTHISFVHTNDIQNWVLEEKNYQVRTIRKIPYTMHPRFAKLSVGVLPFVRCVDSILELLTNSIGVLTPNYLFPICTVLMLMEIQIRRETMTP